LDCVSALGLCSKCAIGIQVGSAREGGYIPERASGFASFRRHPYSRKRRFEEVSHAV
jgi:uncharacterized protein YdbL (DUF1318 family)